MVLLHYISGKIPMHFMKRFFHALKETTQLSFGNISTTANISMSISNSVDPDPSLHFCNANLDPDPRDRLNADPLPLRKLFSLII
jgi:hypothetical protein